MKLQDNPHLPLDVPALVRQLDSLYRQIAQQVNSLSEGQMVASYNAMAASPTTGTWNRGDFVRNSAPSEVGSPGSRYIVFGWTCVVSGTPGTWVQSRYLTGN